MQNKKAIFDGYAAEYDQWFTANEQVFLSELKLLKAALDLTDTTHVLSVGCGSGLFEAALHQRYHLPIFDGVEPSVDMATIARKRGLTVQIATAETVTLQPESYDTIYFNGSSSYMPDLAVAYQNCLLGLKPGGHFILIDVPKESAYGIMYALAKQLRGYTSETLQGVLPPQPYPIELVDSAYWHTTAEKRVLLEDTCHLKHLQYRQTLVANPVYTNQTVEDPETGYTQGGYVAIIAEK